MKKIISFVNEWFFLILLWLAFTMSFNSQELFTGIIITFFITLFTFRLIVWNKFVLFNPVRLFYFVLYVPVFIWAMVKANLDVAWRVIQPKIPINPGIVKLKTNLESNIGKLFLTNSITLTPGTIVFRVNKDELYIHWIDVKSTSKEEQKKIIFEKFENILKKVTD